MTRSKAIVPLVSSALALGAAGVILAQAAPPVPPPPPPPPFTGPFSPNQGGPTTNPGGGPRIPGGPGIGRNGGTGIGTGAAPFSPVRGGGQPVGPDRLTIPLYRGGDPADQQIQLAPWGSGSARLVTEKRPEAAGGTADDPAYYQAQILPVLQKNCDTCHSGTAAKGGVDLSRFTDLASVKQDPATWRRVLNQLTAGTMPPPTAPQPSAEERQRLIAFGSADLAQGTAALVTGGPQGGVGAPGFGGPGFGGPGVGGPAFGGRGYGGPGYGGPGYGGPGYGGPGYGGPGYGGPGYGGPNTPAADTFTPQVGDVVPPSDEDIQLVTHGPYAGGRLVFDKPVNVAAATRSPSSFDSAYLDLLVKVPSISDELVGTSQDNIGGAPGMPGAAGYPGMAGGGGYPGMPGGARGGGYPGMPGGGKYGAMMGGARGGGYPGMGGGGYPGMGGGGYPGMGGRPGGSQGQSAGAAPHMDSFRIVVLTNAAAGSAVWKYPNVETSSTGWAHVYVPLQDLRGLAAGRADAIREIRFFSNYDDKFLLGQANLVVDRRPISLDLTESANNAFVDEPVTFTAATPTGAVIPEIEWDFGDGNPPQVGKAEISHAYKTDGTYTVTATVFDQQRIKQPVSRTIKVTINPRA